MARVVIDKYGVKTYYNYDGQKHRTDGPAVIYPHGAKFYFINNQRRNNGDPTTIYSNGVRVRDADFYPMSTNFPTRDHPNGYKRWYTGKSRFPVL